MQPSVAMQIFAALVLVAMLVIAFPSAEPKKQLTVNDRAAWGYDESGYLVNPPPEPIRMTLK